MKSSFSIRIGAALAVVLLCASPSLALWSFIVESRANGQHFSTNYTDVNMSGNSSVKSTASGCTAATGGCRYATNTSAQATFTFTCEADGDYDVHATWAASTNGDEYVNFTVNYEGGSQTVTKNQRSTSNAGCSPPDCCKQNQWVSLGTFHYHAGGSGYTVVITNPTLENCGGASPRMIADAVRWSATGLCTDVATVTVATPIIAGDTKVRVGQISTSPAATEVQVYVDGAATVPPSTADPGGAPTYDVTVPALTASQRIGANQTVNGVVGCVPRAGTGPAVGDPAQIPLVEPKYTLVADDTSVTVQTVDFGSTGQVVAVKVYQDDGTGTYELIGTKSGTGLSGLVTVPLDSGKVLVTGRRVKATQTFKSYDPANTATLEGNKGTGVVVDERGQVPALTLTGMIDAGRTFVRVTGVDATNPNLSAVTIYANNGTADRVIGTKTSSFTPDAKGGILVFTEAFILGEKIKATQTIRIEGSVPTAGQRVMAAWTIEDFQDFVMGTSYIANPPSLPPVPSRTWYDVSNVAWNTVSKFGEAFFGQSAMEVKKEGWTNGVYALYDAIVPVGGTYHLEADMLVDERGTDTTIYSSYQMGAELNAPHRAGIGIISNSTSILGNYQGLSASQNGYGVDAAAQTVYSNSFVANPGDDLRIAFSTSCSGYSLSGQVTWPGPGMIIGNIRLIGGLPPCSCERVGGVTIDYGPVEEQFNGTAQTNVTVTGISTSPQAVLASVYEYAKVGGVDTYTLKGTVVPTGNTASVPITLPVEDPVLHAGRTLVATQSLNLECPGPTPSDPTTFNDIEGCKPTTGGVVVGTGKNKAVLLSIGIRETGGSGPAGGDGGSTGTIEWLGASAVVSSAPQGKPFATDTGWQQIKFKRGVDTVKAFSGDGNLTGTWGVLESLAITMDTSKNETGRYELYIDNVMNGTTLITDFDTTPSGTTFTEGALAMFNLPRYSSTTTPNLLTQPNVTEVSSTQNYPTLPGKSVHVQFQFRDIGQGRYLRLTTFPAATPQPLVNPLVNLDEEISMWVYLKGPRNCGTVWADRDADLDVDLLDFAEFQKCFSGTEAVSAGCECFDRNDSGTGDGFVDATDFGSGDPVPNNTFIRCFSGPGIKVDITAKPDCRGN